MRCEPHGQFAPTQQVDIVLKLHSIGLPIADEYLYEFSGIPKPDNYEALLRERAEKEEAMKQALEGGERKDKPQDEGSEGEGGEGKAPKGNNPPKPKKGLRNTLSRFFGRAEEAVGLKRASVGVVSKPHPYHPKLRSGKPSPLPRRHAYTLGRRCPSVSS